ncbi:hypothetical protein V2G26_015163 [Clonostachys chloroleuca]
MTHARRAKRSLLNKNACTDSFAIFEIDQRARASGGHSATPTRADGPLGQHRLLSFPYAVRMCVSPFSSLAAVNKQPASA